MASITIRITHGGEPVEGAEIYVIVSGFDLGDGPIGTTDAQGEFTRTVPAGFDRLVRGQYVYADGVAGFGGIMKAGQMFEIEG